MAVGDPAMVVDVPANAKNQAVDTTDSGTKVVQQPLFSLDLVDNVLTAALAKSSDGFQPVPQVWQDAFKAHGVTLSDKAIVTTSTPEAIQAGESLVEERARTVDDPRPVQPERGSGRGPQPLSIVSTAVRNEAASPT